MAAGNCSPTDGGSDQVQFDSFSTEGTSSLTSELGSQSGNLDATLSTKAKWPLRRALWWATGTGCVSVVGVVLLLSLRGIAHPANVSAKGHDEPTVDERIAIPVNIVRPQRKTLERTLEQPGTIKPWAQAELYAKASGYLETIHRHTTPELVAGLVSQSGAEGCCPLVASVRLATAAIVELQRAPQIDIGSTVKAGQLLMEISTPERLQDIVEKRTLIRQREAELEAARSGLLTFEAAIQCGKAQLTQTKAEIRKFASEHAFRVKEFNRLKELVQSRTVPQEIADEKEYQVGAALAGWESSQAKSQTAQAELAVLSAKLSTAQADIKIKETQVQIAHDELRLAILLADYRWIRAPFDGIVTFRDLDEGDFVQNATSGAARRLMTVTALDKVKVVLQVPDRDAPWIHIGTEAGLHFAGRFDVSIVGRVARVASVLDAQTRTMQVEIDLDNPGHRLLPGMYGKATLSLQKIANAQAIPATAVYSRRGRNYVLLVQNGVAHRQLVRIRYDDGKEMEVVKLKDDQEIPLAGSDELIVSNKGEIADGQPVKATLLTKRPGTRSTERATKDARNGKVDHAPNAETDRVSFAPADRTVQHPRLSP